MGHVFDPNVLSNVHDHIRITNVVSLAPPAPQHQPMAPQPPALLQPQGAVAQMNPYQGAGDGVVHGNQGAAAEHAPVIPPRRVRRGLLPMAPSRHCMVLRNNRPAI